MKILRFVTLLFMIALGIIVFFCSTEPGLLLSIDIAKKLAPGTLTIDAPQGRLLGAFTFKSLTYDDKKNHITIKNAAINWKPVYLLRHKINIQSLHADSIFIHKKIKTPATPLKWPWQGGYTISNVTLPKVTFKSMDEAAITVTNIQLQAMGTGLLVKHINATWYLKKNLWQLAGSSSLAAPYPASFELSVAPLLKTGLEGKVYFSGKNKKYTIKGAFKQPINIDIEGSIINNKLSLQGEVKNLKTNTVTLPQAKISLESYNISKGLLKHLTGRLDLFNKKIHLTPLNVDISTQPILFYLKKGRLEFNSQLKSGQGTLQLNGQGSIDNNDFTLTATGNKFMVANTERYKVQLNPDLKLHWKDNQLFTTGQVTVYKIRVYAPVFNNVVTMPEDTVYAANNKKKSMLKFSTTSNIKLDLGNDTKVDAFGLKGKITGQLQLTESPETTATAIGQLRVLNGEYKAYGKKLNIRHGQVIFTGGAVNNPGLNVSAIKHVNRAQQTSGFALKNAPEQSESIIVGVNISGTVKNPSFNLFSEPADLSQADIFSYLVLGRPTSAVGPSDGASLLGALGAMRLSGTSSNQVLKQLQDSIGLDKIAVESDQRFDPTLNQYTNETQVVLGKALSPRLFISYSLGILSGNNIFKAEYKLTKHFSIQSETDGNASGADIIYSRSR